MEGEGCFYATPRKCAQFRIHAAQKQLWPLEKIRSLIGGTINGKGKEYYQWTLSGTEAIQASLMIFPFLSPRRKFQFEKYLSKWEHVSPEGHR